MLEKENIAAQEQRDRAIREAEDARKLAEQTAKTNQMLENKLTETDAAMKEYRTLKAQEAELKAKLAEADRKLADTIKDAEIERMRAVAELEKEVAVLKAKAEVLSRQPIM